MAESERLIELLNSHCALRLENIECTNESTEDCSTCLANFLLKNDVSIVVRCKECEYYIKSCKICKKLSGLKMTIPEFGCVLGKRREG